MRSTDPDPQPFRPLGERVERKVTEPPPAPTPRGPYGIVEENGKLRTTKEPPR